MTGNVRGERKASKWSLLPLKANVRNSECGVDWQACSTASKQCVRMSIRAVASDSAQELFSSLMGVCHEALIGHRTILRPHGITAIMNIASHCLDQF